MKWNSNKSDVALILLGIGILCFSIGLAIISAWFNFDTAFKDRPLIEVVVLLIVGSVLWLAACWTSSRLESESRKRMLWWIVGVGIVSRIVLLGSTPILEVDLYRYLWDGNVTVATGDPYEYAPIEFVQWNFHPDEQYPFERSEEEVQWHAEFWHAQDLSMKQTLQIMTAHFGQYTSPYPPVSQAVFAAADYSCPQDSSLKTHVVVLKGFLVLFDIAAGIVLILILRTLKLPETMSIVWFWSPLVLKEFANGGHLDSITIFFCSLFVLFATRQILDSERKFRYSLLAAVFLSFGIAAKVYPFVLVPLWGITTLRKLGARAVWPLIVLTGTTGVLLLPMQRHIAIYQNSEPDTVPKPGILAFADEWEMNDFLFMVVMENIKEDSTDDQGESTAPWFVITPESWRADTDFATAFSGARRITLFALVIMVLWLSWRWWTTETELQPKFFVECVFLTLAWFWFLSPTQNPWYWCWALPFVPFAKSRVWYLVAMMTLLYYLRFWFGHIKLDNAAFDIAVPVLEFAPILILLVLDSLRRKEALNSLSSVQK